MKREAETTKLVETRPGQAAGTCENCAINEDSACHADRASTTVPLSMIARVADCGWGLCDSWHRGPHGEFEPLHVDLF